MTLQDWDDFGESCALHDDARTAQLILRGSEQRVGINIHRTLSALDTLFASVSEILATSKK
jgi:hypothetical protein